MTSRKHRIRVVLDTNVFVRNFKSRSKSSANRRIVRLWLVEKQLQLIVSRDIIAEYLEIFESVLGMDDEIVDEWQERFLSDSRVTLVSVAKRDELSRDPDDNEFLSAARAGRAHYLVTNDRDLLDLPAEMRALLPFSILTPSEFLAQLDKDAE